MQLKDRLKTICDFVIPGNIVADIGTDHAYLPIYLVEQGITNKALACDVHSGPYNAAKRAVNQAGLKDKIDVRLGDGITVISPGEVETVVIAGMGGTTMIDILTAKPEVTASLQQLVLQPMNAAKNLRMWLNQNGWQITQENLVVDEGRLYEIICAKQGEDVVASPIFYEVGPRLWEERHPLLKQHLLAIVSQTKKVLEGMAVSEQAKTTKKYQQEQQKILELEDLLKCL